MASYLQEKVNPDHARLHAIVGATPECIKIVEPDGTLSFINQAGLYNGGRAYTGNCPGFMYF